MGFYLETEGDRGKANWLVEHAKAERLTPSGIVKVAHDFGVIPADKMLACVVDNGSFEAAGLCFDRDEFLAFAHPDGRPKSWLLVPKAEIIRMKPHLREFVENGNWRS